MTTANRAARSFVSAAAIVFTFSFDAASARAADAASDAHLRCERTLRDIALHRKSIDAAIQGPDLAKFNEIQKQIGDELRTARSHMESALLTGRWSRAPLKQDGFDLSWRIDALQTLSFIAYGFGTGYNHPTKKPSASMQDASRRLFEQLDHLIVRVADVNRRVAGTRRGKEGAKQ
jgi:hypothetical protein